MNMGNLMHSNKKEWNMVMHTNIKYAFLPMQSDKCDNMIAE